MKNNYIQKEEIITKICTYYIILDEKSEVLDIYINTYNKYDLVKYNNIKYYITTEKHALVYRCLYHYIDNVKKYDNFTLLNTYQVK